MQLQHSLCADDCGCVIFEVRNCLCPPTLLSFLPPGFLSEPPRPDNCGIIVREIPPLTNSNSHNALRIPPGRRHGPEHDIAAVPPGYSATGICENECGPRINKRKSMSEEENRHDRDEKDNDSAGNKENFVFDLSLVHF